MVLTYLHFRILKFPLRLGFSMLSFSLSHRFSDDHDVVCEATCKSWGPNRYQNQYKKGFECKNAHELSMLKMVRGTTMTQEIQFFMKQSRNRRTKGTWHLLVPCSSGSSLFLPDQQPSKPAIGQNPVEENPGEHHNSWSFRKWMLITPNKLWKINENNRFCSIPKSVSSAETPRATLPSCFLISSSALFSSDANCACNWIPCKKKNLST